MKINCIPYTCRSIAGEDIVIGASIGYDKDMNIVNSGEGITTISKAKNTGNKGQSIEYAIDLWNDTLENQ